MSMFRSVLVRISSTTLECHNFSEVSAHKKNKLNASFKRSKTNIAKNATIADFTRPLKHGFFFSVFKFFLR